MQTFLFLITLIVIVTIPTILLVKYAGLTSLFRNTPMYLTPVKIDDMFKLIYGTYIVYNYKFLDVTYSVYTSVSMAINEILSDESSQLECYLDRQVDSEYSIKLLKCVGKDKHYSCTIKTLPSNKTVYYDEVLICPKQFAKLFGYSKSVTIYAKIIPV